MKFSTGLGLSSWCKINSGTVLYRSDFSSTTDGFVTIQASVSAVDDIAGVDDVLQMTIAATTNIHRAQKNSLLTVGKDHKIAFDYYIPSTNSAVDGIGVLTGNGADGRETFNTVDAWTSAVAEFSTVVGNNLIFEMRDGASISFSGNGTDVVYLKNIVVTEK